MMTNRSLKTATLNVTLSFLVHARSKCHALKMASFQFNEENMSLDRVQLVCEQGMKYWMKVEGVNMIEWTNALSTGYNNQFKVVGHIQLRLSGQIPQEKQDEQVKLTSYRLPRSSVPPHTVWVIPTTYEPIFTQVLSQTLELNNSNIQAHAMIQKSM
ncbi:MAG: hypothetical protein P0Y55_04180 [Candidatus Cohnella colombiensis]|uniref:Uncharacterized protein n=1 Tax=Candidatus Cohnella colombiensis TaxID=3121368 RepID=A0AA95JGH7_9BACL|nr:MAG: hypothetical protein P0Y55_04180 [Cohnella sp.]